MLNIPATIALIFVIKKAKRAKNVLGKKASIVGIFTASIAALALQFLWIKKQKQVFATSLI